MVPHLKPARAMATSSLSIIPQIKTTTTKKSHLLGLSKAASSKRGPIEEETYVWHPNTRKEAEHKKQSFIDRKKWLL